VKAVRQTALVAAWTLSSLGFSAVGSSDKVHRSVDQYFGNITVSVGSFLTRWDQYHNDFLAVDFALNREGELAFAFEGQYRSDLSFPVLGNVEHLKYRIFQNRRNSFFIGRDSALETISENLSVKDRLNHRVCFTAFECVRGGVIGAHYAYDQDFKISLELMTIPNLSPMISIDENGELDSENRWTSAPIESIVIDGKTIPVRVSNKFTEGLSNFFRPGIQLQAKLLDFDGHSTSAGASYSLSKMRSDIDTSSIRFVEGPNGDALAVANNQKDSTLEYRQLYWMSSKQELSSWAKLIFETSFENHDSIKRYSVFAGSEFNTERMHLSIAAGLLHDFETIPAVESKTRYRLTKRWSLGAWTLFTLRAKKESGLLIEPKTTFAFSKAVTFSLKTLLIRSAADDTLLGLQRGNDFILGEFRYEF